jgi:hypothetical protein
MAYSIQGTYYEPCSCKVACPCAYGEQDGDQGWCSGVIMADVRGGEADGVDLAGTRAALVADWPRGFLAGEGTGRIYVDQGASEDQRSALERIMSGQAGGSMEAIAALIPSWLPAKTVEISLQSNNGKTTFTIGDVGQGVIDPLRNQAGEITKVQNIPVAFAEPTILGRGDGTRFHDPQLRDWESLGHAAQGDFDWNG